MLRAAVNFCYLGYSYYKGLFGWLSWTSYISNVVIRPALLVMLFGLVGRFAVDSETGNYLVLGRLAYSIVFIHMGGITQSFMYERLGGTAYTVFATSSNRLVNYTSRGLLHFPNGLIVVASGVAAGWAFVSLPLDHVNWGGSSLALLAISASSIAFALLIGTFTFVLRDWTLTYSGFSGLLLALTGAVIPVSALPVVLKQLSQFLPLTHGLAAFRDLYAGASIASVWEGLLLEAVIGLAYFAGGYVVFRLVEYRARQTGSLEFSAA